MTIYCIIDTDTPSPVWTIFSGASILQGGNPYFLPDFARNFEAVPTLALRIGKLGKGFADRFSHRYVDGVAPCAVMAARDLLTRLREDGMPWTRAICYDRSLALGTFRKTDFCRLSDLRVEFTLCGQGLCETSVWNAADAGVEPGQLISAIARDNTLKTGDIVLLPLRCLQQGIPVSVGMRASLKLDGEECAAFNIR